MDLVYAEALLFLGSQLLSSQGHLPGKRGVRRVIITMTI